MKRLSALFRFVFGLHFFGSLAIVSLIAIVISSQMTDRHEFANSELYQDVLDRWGAPIEQPAPSVRYVLSGSVFNTLEPLVLDHQTVRVASQMNYRKRGLVYFSGFDFTFSGSYQVTNQEAQDIDAVFVFPLNMPRDRVLLSDLSFLVDGRAEAMTLAENADRLSWTGRLQKGQSKSFDIRFKGRGLDSFLYRLDPASAVKNLDVQVEVLGGDNYDYPAGVMPASSVETAEGKLNVAWTYRSLEAGVPVGLILPSEKSFDAIITTMLVRSWATFLLFFAGISLIALHLRRRLEIYEAYLVSAGYGFFFVLLAYFAAFMGFYLAYLLSLAISGLIIGSYLSQLFGKKALLLVSATLASSLFVPTLAVILRGYTGLIYTLEILVGLVVLMRLSTHRKFRDLFDHLLDDTL